MNAIGRWTAFICAIWWGSALAAGEPDVPIAGTGSSATAASGESQLVLERVRDLCSQGDWSAATELLVGSAEKWTDPASANEARFWTGYCRNKLGEYAQAAEAFAPFETSLSGDAWADDAHLQLGYARIYGGDPQAALAAWRKLLASYPESIWRTETWLQVVDALYYYQSDMEGCLDACRSLLAETPEMAATAEARYKGAFALAALGRPAEAHQWQDKWLDPDSPREQAWAVILNAQHKLVAGQTDIAQRDIDSLSSTFPDLDLDARRDVVLRASYMLRYQNQPAAARGLVVAELRRSLGQADWQVQQLLDELHGIAGYESPDPILAILAELVSDAEVPVMTQVVIRDRQVRLLRDAGRAADAAELLKKVVAESDDEFVRFRAGLLLAEVQAADLHDPGAAKSTLAELAGGVHRRDLVRVLEGKAAEYGGGGGAAAAEGE